MKTDFKVIVCILLVFIQFSIQAQKNGLDNIFTIQLKKTGMVVQENKVKGYFSFYLIEKADNDNSIYMIKIFDENTKEIVSEKFKESKNLMILEVAFDNKAILLKFYDNTNAGRGVKYYVYDQSNQLRPIGKPTDNKDDGFIVVNDNVPETLNIALHGVSDKGFLNYAPFNDSKTYGYEIAFIDSKGERKWVNQSETKSGERDNAHILTVGKNKVYSLISNSEKGGRYSSSSQTQYINCINLNTGKKVFETKMEDKDYKYQICSALESESEKNLTVYGLYYPKSVKMENSTPWGMFTVSLDESGEIYIKKTVHLDADVNKYFPVQSYQSLAAVGNIYFHNFFQTADKKIYAIAENYDFKMDGTMLALRLAGARVSVKEFVTKDILIFEFNPDFTLAGVKVFNKTMSNLPMPMGYGSRDAAKVASIVKQQKGFDYLFTQLSQNRDSFIICYKDIDKEDKTRMYNFEAIVHKDNAYTTDKMNMKIDNNLLFALPAKYGHVFISGYIKDEKKQEMRLERINF